MFYFDTINGKKILRSDLIHTEHFFTTRETVIKTKEEDYKDLAHRNKTEIAKYLNVKEDNLISPKQTHTSHIEIAKVGKNDYPDTDGLILTNKEQAIYLNFADCTPVILYDKIKNIGAVSHAGWRGTAGKIAAKTVEKMVKDFDSKPENITAAIGPAISVYCYNVGEDVFDKLKATVCNFDGLYEIRNEEIFVDLKGINKRQLEEVGVKQIDVCPYCTCCDNDLFFSYRKENSTSNRHSAVLILK